MTTATTIHADGSFHEKTTYTGSPAGGLLGAKGSGTGGQSLDMSKQFSIPSGPGIAVAHSKDNQGSDVITVERDVAATGASTDDIVALSDKGKPVMVGTVTVHRLESGEIAYDEKLKWVGTPLPTDIGDVGDLRVKVKAALPEKFRTNTPVIDRSQRAMLTAVAHVLMGPPYPMLFDLMGNQEAAALKLGGALGPQLKLELARGVPELAPDEQDHTVASILGSMDMEKLTQDTQNKSGLTHNGSSAADVSDATSALDSLLFKVSFPGKVVETNGLTDPITGVVYWSLYPMSASIGDIDLHLVVKP